jgi:signal transduction histidine kinase
MAGVVDGETQVKYSGFVVSLVGFLLTRFTVLDAIKVYDSPLQFILAEGATLVMGLGLVVFGMGLAVSTFRRHYVRTVAKWCVYGTVGMLGVSTLTILEKVVFHMSAVPNALSNNFVTTTLVGGAVGGVLIGLRSASNHRNRRELARQADQATLLNRILRHEVLNKTTVIRGYAEVLAERPTIDAEEPLQAISEGADHIGDAIENVGFLVQTNHRTDSGTETLDLAALVSRRLTVARDHFPDAEFDYHGPETGPTVVADAQLATVLDQLLDNAVRHNDTADPRVTVSITTGDAVACITIADNGPGLPADQRTLVEERNLAEFDDPTAGFGLSIVRLLVDSHGWTITLDEPSTDDGGTVVELEVPRSLTIGERSRLGGVEPVQLRNVSVASIIAGIAMGLILQSYTGAIPVIGALYGVDLPVVGWITHLFHSVVFAIGFAGALTRPTLARVSRSQSNVVLIGIAYGVLLWLIAAGIVMPIWLTAVGVPATLPNLSGVGLVGHVLWGAVLAGGYSALPE